MSVIIKLNKLTYNYLLCHITYKFFNIRFSLNDVQCEALKIELSPQLSIGVISDNLERVILFEVNAGGIIR